MKKVKNKFIEQKKKMLKKMPSPLGVEDILNQLAEVIYHSYFKKHPDELQKITGRAKDENNFFEAA